jgi:ribosome-associated heat shock protein Hsp15
MSWYYLYISNKFKSKKSILILKLVKMELSKVRVDKWLWAIRLFKSRTLASDACDAGKVKIEGVSVKASRMISIGETLHIRHLQAQKIFKVKALIDKRVNATLAALCFEDLSPPDENPMVMKSAFVQRDRGAGRPTKKERRNMDDFTTLDF